MYLNTPKLSDDKAWLYMGSSQASVGSLLPEPEWSAWVKPPDASMIFMLLVGGGGAGGNGTAGANTVARSGGAGGGSGAISTMLIDASLVPDVLYINAGQGGDTQRSTTRYPGDSYVCFHPSQSPEYLLTVAQGAQSPNYYLGGAASSNVNAKFCIYGCYNFYAGRSSSSSGGSTSGQVISITPGVFVTPGGGGGNAGSTGGANTGVTIVSSGFPTQFGGAANSSVGGVAGSGDGGYYSIYPLLFSGGAGGGAGSNGRGGDGGPAAPGCGGGGGGGGLTGQAGIGQSGGQGFVYIKVV